MLKQFIDRVWTGGTADSDLYGVVAAELSSGAMDVGIWAKACAISDGDEVKARTRYLQMRVSALKAMHRTNDRITADQQRSRVKAQALEHRQLALETREQQIVAELYELTESPRALQRERARKRVTNLFIVVVGLAVYFAVAGLTFDPALLMIEALFAGAARGLSYFSSDRNGTNFADLRAELRQIRRKKSS